MAKKKDDGTKLIADNRKARHAYAIDSVLEAGILLTGSEVKSLRNGKATIGESYAHAKDGEIFLVNAYIPEYTEASRFNHEPKRTRKLLVRKSEIAKLELAIAKGKKLHDKRETEKQRDWQRDKARLLRNRG